MDESKQIEMEIERLQRGELNLEGTRSLAAKIGKAGFLRGVPTLLALIKHDDEIVRYNAIVSLSFDLRCDSAASELMRLLRRDSDPDCRDAAADGLGSLFRNSHNQIILRTLGEAALKDPDEDIRSAAYMAILNVRGLSDHDRLDLLRGPRLPVDEEFVHTMLRDANEANPETQG